MQTYTGGCHCGKVKFEAQTDLSYVITCNCSHCGMKGLVLTFIPATQFTLLSREEDLVDYQFNKKIIHHLFCRHCGVQSFGRGTNQKGEATVSLNVRCLSGVDIETLTLTPYDGKDR